MYRWYVDICHLGNTTNYSLVKTVVFTFIISREPYFSIFFNSCNAIFIKSNDRNVPTFHREGDRLLSQNSSTQVAKSNLSPPLHLGMRMHQWTLHTLHTVVCSIKCKISIEDYSPLPVFQAIALLRKTSFDSLFSAVCSLLYMLLKYGEMILT